MMEKGIMTDRGFVTGVLDNDCILYKSIPYAEAPIGDLRWKDPQPVFPWSGVRKCDTWHTICPQQVEWSEGNEDNLYTKEFYSDGYPEMGEDCLYLNIWTPVDFKDKNLPVMVFFHGGGFKGGYSYEKEFSGVGMTKKGVILITVNYRLGILGFLAHPELSAEAPYHASGNYGMLDMIESLKWVKNNIKNFGGDPDNITVFGQSAGAMAIAAMNVSPLTKGLYSKAIMQSVGYIDENHLSWVGVPLSLEKAEKIGLEVQECLKCKSLAEMRLLPFEKLIALQNDFFPKSVELTGILFFIPCVDGYFLPDTIKNLVTAGKLADIPYMNGYTTHDMTNAFESAYDFVSYRAKTSNKNTYFYEFARDMPGSNHGAFHSAELWYVFETLDNCWRPLTESDHALARKISTYWTNFAKYGDPNGVGLESWPTFDAKSDFKMLFDT
jgi:para-nitrobenzyl esterase